METTTHKLVYSNVSEAETSISFTIPDVRADVTAEEASAVMDDIIGLNVLQDEAGNKVAWTESCEMVSTTTKPMY